MTTLTVNPVIGSKGSYTFISPFNRYSNNGEIYTCQAIRTIGDYIIENNDPLNNIYLAENLTEDDYNQDKANNINIITLQRSDSSWLRIPSRFISAYPIMNGIEYHQVALGVSLGMLPINYDLSTLETFISNVVYGVLGIIPQFSQVELSNPVLVTIEKDQQLSTARAANITFKLNDNLLLQKTQAELDDSLTKIKFLEKYILDHLPPP